MGSRRGFTLIELLVVITIIAIILSFVIVAATDAARRAEERATQSLITKLEGGMNDRLDALMQSRPDPNWAHGYMAAVWTNWNGSVVSAPSLVTTNGSLNSQLTSTERAQVFAWYDYLKREVPDVFFLQNDPNYPINFAGAGLYGRHGQPVHVAQRNVRALRAAAWQYDRERPGNQQLWRREPDESELRVHGAGDHGRVVHGRGGIVQEPAGDRAVRVRRGGQQPEQPDRRGWGKR